MFGIAFALHLSAAAQLIHPDRLNSSVGFVRTYAGRIGLTFAQKNTLATSSYLTFPYGSFRFPAILLMPIGVAGFVVAFRRRVPSLLVTGGGRSSGSWSTWSWGQRAATGGCMSC